MTGISTSEFIRNIRLEQAARLLREQKINVTPGGLYRWLLQPCPLLHDIPQAFRYFPLGVCRKGKLRMGL